LHKHKYSYLTTYEPDFYIKKGFHSLKKKEHVINVGDLEKLNTNNIDLTALGYDKLLSRGNISKPITVKVKSHSAGAKKKIEKAGGKIIE
jgi:large subunit ribosomal protein L15